MAEAKGRYFKVVDSDDWVDTRAYLKILECLEQLEGQEMVDALITNFVYEKERQKRKKVMSYEAVFPVNQVFDWDHVKQFSKGQYLMMHSLIYRASLLRDLDFQLPEHTFYVDNLFVLIPLQAVRHLYYPPLDFYRYFIGREDQSINEQVMIERIDQQLYVNRLLVDQFDGDTIAHPTLAAYLLNHVEITTVISSVLLNRANTAEHLQKKRALWAYIQKNNPRVFHAIRRSLLGRLTKHSVLPARKLSNVVYTISKSVYGFN